LDIGYTAFVGKPTSAIPSTIRLKAHAFNRCFRYGQLFPLDVTRNLTSAKTSNLLANFVYGMAAHPHIQEKARKVLDSVIGTDRLPNFDDRLDMPYIEAVVYELLRWRPPVPLSVPHVSTEDDYYKGYFIPKGELFFFMKGVQLTGI